MGGGFGQGANGGGFGGMSSKGGPGGFGGQMNYGGGVEQSIAGNRMLQEFELEISRLREENTQLRYQKELKERDFENVMFENNTLYGKLENLENLRILKN